MIVPIPIFIHVREKSDKELREEMKRDAEFRRACEEDDRRRKEREEAEKRKKAEEAERKRKAAEDAYYAAKEKNPWDYQFLPEGWTIFGQRYFFLPDV